MLDILLFLVIVSLIGVIIFLLYRGEKERKILLDNFTIDKNKLINALVARKPEEYRDLVLADKVTPITTPPQAQQSPDLVPLDQVSDEDFDAHIQEQLANG